MELALDFWAYKMPAEIIYHKKAQEKCSKIEVSKAEKFNKNC